MRYDCFSDQPLQANWLQHDAYVNSFQLVTYFSRKRRNMVLKFLDSIK